MKILAFFTSSGVPQTGLSATIRIRDLSDDSLVVTDDAMSESGDGNYKYEFAGYDADKEYAIRCDGGATLSNFDRYKYAGNENYIDDLGASGEYDSKLDNINTNVLGVSATVVENQDDIKRLLGLMHENIYIDNPVYDGQNNLTSARVRIYSSAGSVGTTSDVIGTYEITAPGDGAGKFTSWKQVKEE